MTTLSNAARSAAANGVVDLLDVGTTNANGQVVILDAAAVLVTLPLNNPAFGAASNGVATMGTSPAVSAVATGAGDADNCDFQDRDETSVITGTVGTTGSDINLVGSVAIAIGQTVTLTSGTYTQPAS